MKTRYALSCATSFAVFATGFAQDIPNPGFEDWTTIGTYMDPDGWATRNAANEADGIMPTTERITPGYSGTYAVKITTRGTLANPESGKLETATPDGQLEGFPYTSRPTNLRFRRKSAIPSGDAAQYYVLLTRWDGTNTVTVGFANGTFTGTVTSWTTTNIPIIYADPMNPDTAYISFYSSNILDQIPGSTISLDALSFTGVVGVDEVEAIPFTLHPQPADDQLTLTCGMPMRALSILDMQGREVHRLRLGGVRETIDIQDLPSGIYAMHVELQDGMLMRRTFIRQ